MESSRLRMLYCHGFGSGRLSQKGVDLREALSRNGVELELLELNVPNFETQTYSAILRYLDEVDASTPSGRKIGLLGSSMGGYLAARWAELHPDRVERLFLLCPGFDLASRWPLLLGDGKLERWEADGELEVEDAAGELRTLHWGFVTDARRHPDYPAVRCPTRILHGRGDEIVPIEFSRRFAAERPGTELVEVDDDHRLLSSVPRIVAEVREFFGLED